MTEQIQPKEMMQLTMLYGAMKNIAKGEGLTDVESYKAYASQILLICGFDEDGSEAK